MEIKALEMKQGARLFNAYQKDYPEILALLRKSLHMGMTPRDISCSVIRVTNEAGRPYGAALGSRYYLLSRYIMAQ